jgi:hypothetical protein
MLGLTESFHGDAGVVNDEVDAIGVRLFEVLG